LKKSQFGQKRNMLKIAVKEGVVNISIKRSQMLSSRKIRKMPLGSFRNQ
jgi:hypothetical protein